jgi:60 kDa SS-A/Ro ribonucleoprotein
MSSFQNIVGHVSTSVTSAPAKFVLDDWGRLNRFLVLGSEGGTFYASEKAHTAQAFDATLRCIAADGPRVVRTVVAISDAGRAPKNDPAILVLAACMKKGDDATRKAAQAAVPKVCRIGTHLFHLAEAIQGLGGWGRGTKRAFAEWYTTRGSDDLAMQLVKYQSRDKWSHRDVLRLAKPSGHARGGDLDRLLGWSTKKTLVGAVTTDGDTLPSPVHPLIDAFEAAKRSASPKDSARLIREYNLPRECVRTEHLDSPEVWDALLHAGKYGMPMTAMLRNLGKMSTIGFLGTGSDAAKFVLSRIADEQALKHARVHPLAVLVAMMTYAQGHGVRGSNSWSVNLDLVSALDAAFYKCFQYVEPTDARYYLGLDVSGSMNAGLIAGLPGVTPRVATAALAMVTAKVEKETYAAGFTAGKSGYGGMHGGDPSGLTTIDLPSFDKLDKLCAHMHRMPMGGTDCALPMIDALAKKMPVDCFIVYTDSETFSSVSPVNALRNYREKMGIDARLVVVAMTAGSFTIADPQDSGMLDCCGCDTATPTVISEFVRGKLVAY